MSKTVEKIVIDHTVLKEAEGRYYTIGFDVPPGVEKVAVSYRYKRLSSGRGKSASPVNIVDLGLEDANGRFLGWSGSARESVYVGEFESTKGYLITGIVPGNWKIIVGAYKIAAGGVAVRYEIEFTEKRARWYFGDLHMHSDASDGQHSISELGSMARRKGLDFIAVANHNNFAENLCLPTVAGVTLVPAVEWTHYRGHMNFFGPKTPFVNSFIANDIGQMRRLVGDARSAGAVISVNHPKCNVCPYLWEDDACFDMIEVWNGPMRRANLRAIQWWTSLLGGGRKIPIVGGSDFHRDFRLVRLGHPVTAVYAKSQSAGDILAAAAEGRGYITQSVRGARLALQCRGKGFGDTVALDHGTELTCRADNASRGMRLKIVTDEGITAIFTKRRKRSIRGSHVITKPGFAYLLATRKVLFWEIVCAVSNPIYFES